MSVSYTQMHKKCIYVWIDPQRIRKSKTLCFMDPLGVMGMKEEETFMERRNFIQYLILI